MAFRNQYTCNQCEFEFVVTSGGARSGYFTPYFCFKCIKTTSIFTPYQIDIEKIRPRIIEPWYRSYIFKVLKKLDEKEAEKIFYDIRSDITLETISTSKYSGFFSEINSEYENDMKNYQNHLSHVEKERSRAIELNRNEVVVACSFCKTSEVFEFSDRCQCPLCGSKRLSKLKCTITD